MRIAGVTIPDEKHLEIGLTEIYGIGRSRARKILDELGIDSQETPKNIEQKMEAKLREKVEDYKIEGELKREVSGNIKRLKDIKAYRGVRHTKGLKVRGQRSRTNMRTVPAGISTKRRERKTMGSGKRKIEKK